MTRIFNTKEVQGLFGDCSATTIIRMVKAGTLPPPVKISGGRINGWFGEDIEAAQMRLRASQAAPPQRDLAKIGKGRPGPGRPRKQPAQTA